MDAIFWTERRAELAKALDKTPQATVSFSFLPVSALVALRVMQDGK
jgi:hypothetical protein